MAREHEDQFLHDFRFHARATLAGTGFGSGDDPLHPNDQATADPDRQEAGFQTMSVPNYEVGTAEYRDGLRLYTVKQPGTPETNTITAERGVVRGNNTFLQWMLRYFKGREFYADVQITHWPHSTRIHRTQRGLGEQKKRPDPKKAKQYLLHNAWPSSVSIASDLDADSEDISIAEIEIEYEWFQVAVADNPMNNPVTAPESGGGG